MLHGFPDGSQKVIKLLERRDIRVVGDDLRCGAEQETCFAGLDHVQVIVAVAGGDSVKADGLECLHGGKLGLG